MVKFGHDMVGHLTPEWRKQYIRYEDLKNVIYNIKNGAPGAGGGEPASAEDLESYFKQEDEKFFAECDEELTKINLFYGQKIAEAQQKFHGLSSDVDALTKVVGKDGMAEAGNRGKGNNVVEVKKDRSEVKKSRAQLKLAFSEFYLGLVLVQNYQQLNGTGFRKILKKHDKMIGNERGAEYRTTRVEKSSFFLNREIESLISKTESIVINKLEGGDRQTAMKRLKVPPLSQKQQASTTFTLGLFSGCFIVLAAIILLSVIIPITWPQEPKWVGVRLFRGFFLLFLDVWLVGLNILGWTENGVNHVLIFEIDPRQHLTYQALMQISSYLFVLWSVCVIGYIYAPLMGLSPLLFPLILMAICVVWFFNPLATPEGLFHRSSRYWLLRRCFYCFTAPLHMVTFADFWLGDQMNSLLTVFLDMQYFVCFYATEVDYNGWNVVARAHHSGVNDTIDSLHPVPWGYVDYTSGQDKCSTAAGLRSFVLIIPAAVRFLQCLRRYRDAPHFHPHLTNAGKYMTTFLVVGFGAANRWYVGRSPDISQFASPFFYLWILSYIISFTYTFLWDVFMDWGLCDPKAPKDMPYLRNEMIYGVKWYYYAAIVQDFVLRLLWVMNVSLGEAWTLEAELLLCVTSPLELIRRFIWNFLRLENEHVNNCGNFRAVRDISIKPIEFKGTLETLINKIDNDDAVTHRHDQLNGKQPKKKQRKTAAKRIISHMAHMPLLQHIHLSDHNLHKPWSKHSTSDLGKRKNTVHGIASQGNQSQSSLQRLVFRKTSMHEAPSMSTIGSVRTERSMPVRARKTSMHEVPSTSTIGSASTEQSQPARARKTSEPEPASVPKFTLD